MKRVKWSQIIILIVIIISALSVISLKKDKVKYGLDLKGGVHLVLQAEEIIDTTTAQTKETTKETAKETAVPAKETTTPAKTTDNKTASPTPAPATAATPATTNRAVTAQDLEQAKIVIERRVNALGVAEAVVAIEAKNRIVVDIPGYTDIEQAKNMIGRIAVLTFKDEAGKVLISGKNLKNATFEYQTVQQGGTREPVIALEWDDAGKKIFADATAANVGKTIAIYLDEELLMSPKVNEAIEAGNAVITFGGTGTAGNSIADQTKQAQQYAALLKGGSLPVKMSFLEERVVGPSLGKDTIDRAIIGFLVACLAVMLYIILFYKTLGLLGSLALIVYAIIYLGFLLLIGAVFSLPAIGAVILSIGMAVDSNVVIFERIKEEYRKGRTFRSAIGSGFSHGFIAILDSNLSMLLGMSVLWYYGTVQIKGFAITLVAGIIAALFTSLFLTRVILETISLYKQNVNEKLFGL
jgi:preprotein translocase subunit SecD